VKKGLTELMFILDRSGSMGGLETDTIGGYNSLLNTQKEVKGEAHITTILFDQSTELFHDRIDLKGVKPMSKKDYQVGGSTALLDAIGFGISKITKAIKQTEVDYQPEKVMVVIITDGEENSSRNYTSDTIKAMINTQTKLGWEFIFLGANIDAVKTAANFGIDPSRATNFHNDTAGVELNYQVMNAAICSFRTSDKLEENWKEAIEKDFDQRGNK